ncbi:MAG: hypothetical protein ABSA97_04250 [Verrucomicrobiia bacterium]
MSDETSCAKGDRIARAFGKLAVILAGIVVGQFILYGPSLVGRKILLPLDILASRNVYLARTPEVAKIIPHDFVRSDLVLYFEPRRQFTVSEIRAGRFPLWVPYQYAGAPFVEPKYSPLRILLCLTASPLIHAWFQLVIAMIAGMGVYLFCRRTLQIGFRSATITAWCYPMTGLFVFGQGYHTGAVVLWLPWLLLAVDKTVRRASPAAPIWLGVVTGFVLTSGPTDIAGQVLLASGVYAVWCLLTAYRKQWFKRRARGAILALTVGWSLGFLLAAPHLLPLLEYAHTGSRMQRRSRGEEERPPVGWAALPQTVLPDMYGVTRTGSLRIVRGNQIESSAATYAGVIATLFVAPLAWCSRRHRMANTLWCVLGFLGLSWCLNIPGLVELLRLPGLNMMSHNRLVFVTSFAILAMTATGLDVLGQAVPQRRRWFWLPTALLAGLCVWCIWRAVTPPEPIATQLESAIRHGKVVGWVSDLDGVRTVQKWFARSYLGSAVLCGLGVAGWLLLWFRWTLRPWLVPALGVVLVGDLLWFAYDRSAQCDPALYYPRIPVLEQLAKETLGRIVGYICLPAQLAQTHGLRDIRGVDGIDPARLMDLMAIAADPRSPRIRYALTQWFVPRATVSPPDGIRLSPVLDMLGVRYVIFRGSPPASIRPAFQGFDYWVLVNRAALPRAFVPRRVETVANDREQLEKLAAPQFDPREVAYVETPVNLPELCHGSAEIVAEIPTRVTMSVHMETPGLIVLADLWDNGWRAYLNGQPVAILRANHAVRGVIVPAGAATLDFRYEPPSFALGLWLSGLAAMVLLGWLGTVAWQRWTARGTAEELP